MLLISEEIFSLEESVFSLKCASEEYEAERGTDALFFVFFSVLFGSDEDAERRAEKTERGRERFFVVGFDREVRRYLFRSHSSEIECDGFEILVRCEYGDEKVD